MIHKKRPSVHLAACLLPCLLLAAGLPAAAELIPDWTAHLPLNGVQSSTMSDILVDAAGVSYVTGTQGPPADSDVATAAFAPDGTLLWKRVYDGSTSGIDQGHALALGPGGLLWVAGSEPDSTARAEVLLLSYDVHTGAPLDSLRLAADPSESGREVVVDAAGNVYVGGSTVGDGNDGLILAFSPDLELLWRETWDGAAFGSFSQDTVEQVELAADGDLLVLLKGVTGANQPDYVVVKYAAATGAIVWEASWGDNGGESPREMELDAAGDVYVTGSVGNQYGTIKLSGTDGSLLWEAIDSPVLRASAWALALDEDGVYVTGDVDPDGDFSNLNDDMYTVKRDAATGALVWSNRYGDSCVGCNESTADLAVDPDGNVFLSGRTSTPPYNNDVIHFQLDAATGVEIDRGILDTAGTGSLTFDSGYDLFDSGSTIDPDDGGITMAVTKFPSKLVDPYTIAVSDLVAGSEATFTISNATPGATQYVVASVRGLGTTEVPQLGVTLDLAQPRLLGSGPADASGFFEATLTLPAGASGRTIWMQGAEDGAVTRVVRGEVQ